MSPSAGDRPRYEIQRDIKRKERAREMLCKRYKSRTLKEDDILLCLYSISDNNSFLLFNRDPSGYTLLLPVRSCGSASPIRVSL